MKDGKMGLVSVVVTGTTGLMLGFWL